EDHAVTTVTPVDLRCQSTLGVIPAACWRSTRSQTHFAPSPPRSPPDRCSEGPTQSPRASFAPCAAAHPQRPSLALGVSYVFHPHRLYASTHTAPHAR